MSNTTGTRWGVRLDALVEAEEKGMVVEGETAPNLQPSLLPPDSLASLSVLPGSNSARQMTATSGLKLSQLLKKSNPSGYCLKMLLESSTWHSTLCYLTWKVRVTPQKRLLFQLAPSMPGIDETEFGLWPTSSARDWKSGQNKNCWSNARPLNEIVLLPTPEAQNQGGYQISNGKKMPRLGAVVKMWPTPQTGAHNEAAHNAMSGDWKTKFCEVAGIPTTGQLNPNWVEWLMGFPTGWTDLNASEMP
nr:hypothetical protein [Candidatus Magnetobacterium casensis]